MKAQGGKFRSTICGIAHIFFYQIILDLETHLEFSSRHPKEHPYKALQGYQKDNPKLPYWSVLRIDLETICIVISLVMLHSETMLETL